MVFSEKLKIYENWPFLGSIWSCIFEADAASYITLYGSWPSIKASLNQDWKARDVGYLLSHCTGDRPADQALLCNHHNPPESDISLVRQVGKREENHCQLHRTVQLQSLLNRCKTLEELFRQFCAHLKDGMYL